MGSGGMWRFFISHLKSNYLSSASADRTPAHTVIMPCMSPALIFQSEDAPVSALHLLKGSWLPCFRRWKAKMKIEAEWFLKTDGEKWMEVSPQSLVGKKQGRQSQELKSVIWTMMLVKRERGAQLWISPFAVSWILKVEKLLVCCWVLCRVSALPIAWRRV